MSAGWLVWSIAAACSCGQPPVADADQVAVPPQDAAPAAPPVEPVARVPAEPPVSPLPSGPVRSPQADRAHAQGQGLLLRGRETLPPLRPVPEPVAAWAQPPRAGLSQDEDEGEAAMPEVAADAHDASMDAGMPGYFVPITAGESTLAHFHAALADLQRGRDADGKVRVAMYGASGTAADLSVGYVRAYLQTRFGDGGPGFVPLVPLSRWYRHSEVQVSASKGWRKEHAQIRSGRQDGLYGLLGASFTATDGKRWATVEPKERRVSAEGIARVELMFLRQPQGGTFEVRIDGGAPQRVSTAAPGFEPGYHVTEVEPGPHTVAVRTLDEAEVRVFGVVLERAEPGVVVDVLGIDGTRGGNHLSWDEALWADNLARRAPDLYTLSYGTNESVDEDMSIQLYAEGLREQLQRFARVLPESSCVLLGPCDFPVREGDQLRPRPLLREIIAVQREVAEQEGCGFWDGVAFMGGELSMEAWVQAEPPLARGDYLHFNARGAARKGMALSDALLHAFDARSMGVDG